MVSHADLGPIAVVGTGAAGIAAAVTAARSGIPTLVLDRDCAPGGIGGFSGLTTMCGLYDDAGQMLNQGFASEFAAALGQAAPVRMGRAWVLPYRPERFRELATQWLSSMPNLRALWNSTVRQVTVEDSRITELNGMRVGAVIDCSGTAEVARAANVSCLETDEKTQASAVVFELRNVTRELNSTAAAVQVLLPLARAGLPPVSFEPNPEPGAVTVKLAGRPEQAPTVIEFLRKSVTGFGACQCPTTLFQSSRRAGRMVPGVHVLTGAEVLAGRKFPDAVARCAWPIEQWDATGRLQLRYLPEGEYYEIPARCLRSVALENLYMAGKTISADVEAIASARVMGCCLATGAAAGALAIGSLSLR